MLRYLPVLAVTALAAIATPAMAVTAYNFGSLSGTSFGASAPGFTGVSATATLGGATFSTNSTGDYTFGPNGGNFPLLGATILEEGDALFNAPLTITFATPVRYGLSFDFATEDLFGASDTLGVSVNGGTPVSYTATAPGSDFYPQGKVFLANGSISSIRLTNANGIVLADLQTNVPEPASFALLGAGLIGLAGTRLRRQS